jgi:hypothetical protein
MSISSSPLRIASSAALFSIVDISPVNPPPALKTNCTIARQHGISNGVQRVVVWVSV